jgi:hypothetical protein
VYLRLKVYGEDTTRVTATAKRSKLTFVNVYVCVFVFLSLSLSLFLSLSLSLSLSVCVMCVYVCLCALQYLCATTHSALLRWRPPSDLGAGPEEPVKIVEFRIQSGNTEAEMLASTTTVSVRV